VRLFQNEAPAERALRPAEYMYKYSFRLNQVIFQSGKSRFVITPYYIFSEIGDLVIL
jgi:hypothetical protein